MKKIKLMSLFLSIFRLINAEQYLDAVNVNLFPEYYYSGVMVEMEAVIVADSESEIISLSLPAEADSVFFIGGIPNPNSEVISLTILKGAPYSHVEFSAAHDQFRLFVFYNPFDSGYEKYFRWSMGTNIAMKNVHYSVQVPVMAEQFVVSRDISSEERDQHGIIFKSIHIGEISGGTVVSLDVSYINSSGQTTMEYLRAQLEQPQVQNPEPVVEHSKPKRHTLLLWEPLAILGVLSIIIGLMYYSSNKNTHYSKENRNFCRSCGSKLNFIDIFCANCGEKKS